MEKLILVDADGVLLAWDYAFDVWMNERGFSMSPNGDKTYSLEKKYNISPGLSVDLIKLFNESAAIGFLPPLRDAVHYVRSLHEDHGYEFVCITSLSTDKNAGKLRKKNLKKLFGKTAFRDIICLETGAPKDDALLPYKNSGLIWVEDRVINAQTGAKLGLKSIIMEHGHNLWYKGPIPVVKNWAEIYDMIV
jgi:hypothetical protein